MGVGASAGPIAGIILSIIGLLIILLIADWQGQTAVRPHANNHPLFWVGHVKTIAEMENQVRALAARPNGERWHFAGFAYDSLGPAGRRIMVAFFNDAWKRRTDAQPGRA